MKPILIFLLGAGVLWAWQRSQKQVKGQGIVLAQTQRGISTYAPAWTPAGQAQTVHAGLVNPPLASSGPGYIPAFGPTFQAVDPNSLYWNQA